MFREILPNLFFFQSPGIGSNVFLLAGTRKTALIDSSAEANSLLLQSSFEGIGFSPFQVGLVLHTHGHADHFGGDFLFKKAEIRMHEFDAKFVNSRDFEFTAANMSPTKNFPKITGFFKQNETIDLGGFKLKVIFAPGHTQGSVCFFEEKQKLLFSGDTLFCNGFGRFDLPSGNRKKLFASIKKISKFDFSLLLPGHDSILEGNQKQNLFFAIKALGKAFL